jgi:Na+/citrate or Na+/malate symporter
MRASPWNHSRFPSLGLDALALVLVPSYGVHANWIGAGFVDSVRTAVEASHAINGFICILIVGSVLGIDVRPLARTFPRLIVVILAASIAALAAGAVGGFFAGHGVFNTLFLVIVPIMSGGVSAGILPLALGYGDVFGEGILAALLPPVLLANLATIVLAGTLGHVGRWRKRHATAEGKWHARKASANSPQSLDFGRIGVAILMLLGFAVAAYWAERMTGVSEPLFLFGLAGLLLLTDVLPATIRRAIVAVYRFSARVLVFPVLIVVGLLFSPWEILLAGFSAGNLLIVSATVAALAAAGYAVSRWIGLDPIDGSIMAVSRAAMGGTGDIAMLSAARRLDLMPFAQIATRLGGAATIFLALLAL